MTRRNLLTILGLCSIGMCSGCAQTVSINGGQDKDMEQQRVYLLERVDDVAVVQLYADGFNDLPLNEKILVYHLYQAAVAGRDIFIDQKYAPSLELRDLLEEVWTHREGIEESIQAEIERYLKLFWINNGPHNAITGRKNVMTCSFENFSQAVLTAQASGAQFAFAGG